MVDQSTTMFLLNGTWSKVFDGCQGPGFTMVYHIQFDNLFSLRGGGPRGRVGKVAVFQRS